jgi:hypothetical protein
LDSLGTHLRVAYFSEAPIWGFILHITSGKTLRIDPSPIHRKLIISISRETGYLPEFGSDPQISTCYNPFPE